MVSGKLGPACSAKVATTDFPVPQPLHVICIYVDPFHDLEKVRSVFLALKEHGLSSSSFKLDLFTYLDIVSGNPWKLKPSVFTAASMEKDLEKFQDEMQGLLLLGAGKERHSKRIKID